MARIDGMIIAEDGNIHLTGLPGAPVVPFHSATQYMQESDLLIVKAAAMEAVAMALMIQAQQAQEGQAEQAAAQTPEGQTSPTTDSGGE